MAKLTAESFLNVVQQSGLVEKLQLKQIVKELREREANLKDSRVLADELVERGLLTRWQCDKLLQGKHKGFFLGKYRLLNLLGKGGMSSVYLAEHVLMRRRCAIKVLPAKRVDDSSYLGRFHREAQAVASLDHPNIVRAYDVDCEMEKDTEIHFLVMEYVKGQSLHEMVLEGGPLGYVEAADYLRQAADGLEHAHKAGLVHRDIKPGNVLVDTNGVVKVLDLGLARFFDEEDENPLTVAHDEKVLGTADYLAPEQALDSHSVDVRADIYSLGCTIYFTLTGHPPFNEGTLAQRLMWHQTKEPPSITEDCPDISPSMVAIIEKMMAKKVEERYQTAAAVAAAIEAWLLENGGDEWRLKNPAIAGASGGLGSDFVPQAGLPAGDPPPTAAVETTAALPAEVVAAPAASPVLDSAAAPTDTTMTDPALMPSTVVSDQTSAASATPQETTTTAAAPAEESEFTAFLTNLDSDAPATPPTAPPPLAEPIAAEPVVPGASEQPPVAAAPVAAAPVAAEPVAAEPVAAEPTVVAPVSPAAAVPIQDPAADAIPAAQPIPVKPEPPISAAPVATKSVTEPLAQPVDQVAQPPVAAAAELVVAVPVVAAATPIAPATPVAPDAATAPPAEPVTSPALEKTVVAAPLAAEPVAETIATAVPAEPVPASDAVAPAFPDFTAPAAPTAPLASVVPATPVAPVPFEDTAPAFPDFSAPPTAPAVEATPFATAPIEPGFPDFSAMSDSAAPTAVPAEVVPAFDPNAAPAASVPPIASAVPARVAKADSPLNKFLQNKPAVIGAAVVLVAAIAFGAYSMSDSEGGDGDTKVAKNKDKKTTKKNSGSANGNGSKRPSEEFLDEIKVGGPDGNFNSINAAIAYVKKNKGRFDNGSRRNKIEIKVAGGVTYKERISVDNSSFDYPRGIRLIVDGDQRAILAPTGPGPVVKLKKIEFFAMEGFELHADGKDVAIELTDFVMHTSLKRMKIQGFTKAGILGIGAAGTNGDELILEDIAFHSGSPSAVGMRFGLGDGFATTSRIKIAKCKAFGPMAAGIEFESSASYIDIRESIFDQTTVGIKFGGKEKMEWRDILIGNNTFYNLSKGISFTHLPMSSSNSLAFHRNLFSGVKGPEAMIEQGYKKPEFDKMLSTNGAAIEYNWSDRPAPSAPANGERELILSAGHRVQEFQFANTNRDDPKYLAPAAGAPHRAAGRPRFGLKPHIGAVAP